MYIDPQKLIGFEVFVELTEIEAHKHGQNLGRMAETIRSQITEKVPVAKVTINGVLQKPKRPNTVLIYNRKKNTLTADGKDIQLSRVEELILTRLTETPNEYVSYAEILSMVSTHFPHIDSPSHLRVTIHRLRNKFGIDRNLLRTDRSFGYSLKTDTSRLTIV